MTYDLLLAEAMKLPAADRERLAAALRDPPADEPDGDDGEGMSVYDALVKSGFFDIPVDPDNPMPSDLSTNPKHMEGFGRRPGRGGRS